jgi:hypothetical protein
VGSVVLAIVSTRYGLGYLVWDIKPEWGPSFRKACRDRVHPCSLLTCFHQMIVAGSVLFTVNIAMPKISICFTYLYLFPLPRNIAFCYIMITFLSCWWISTVLVTIFQCRYILLSYSFRDCYSSLITNEHQPC